MSFASHLRKDFRLTFLDYRGILVALLLPLAIIIAYSNLNLAQVAGSGRNPDAFILVLCATFPILLVGSTALLEERRVGTFGRLARSPANMLSVVLSKWLTAGALVALQVVVIVITSWLALPNSSPNLSAHVGQVALILLTAGMAAQAIGLLLSAIASSELQAMQLASLMLLLMFTLSGFLQPLDQIGMIGEVAVYLPLAAGYTALQSVLDQVGVPDFAVIVLSGIALVAIAVLATQLTKSRRE